MRRGIGLLLSFLLIAACGVTDDDGVVDIAFIEPSPLHTANDGAPSELERALMAASRQGLVRFNEVGEVVPALAERWIVTDDGRSYIFRITEYDMPDGTRLTAQEVAASLRRTIAGYEDTSLGLDLAKITDVRAMTGRVIEIRLSNPMPALLQLLAQPELGVSLSAAPTGLMAYAEENGTHILQAVPPEVRGLAEQSGWEDLTREVRITPRSAQQAARAFSQGEVDMIMGGDAASLPLAVTGALSRGTVRIDPTLGLFGLEVVRARGILASSAGREAIAMAIDRPGLVQQLNLGGWAATTLIVPRGLPDYSPGFGERWAGQSLDQRRARASAVVDGWRRSRSQVPSLTIALPEGPGSDFIFASLQRDMNAIGITASRVTDRKDADLVLKDETARYVGARWFLNQFNCTVSPNACSPDADFLVQLALDAADPEEEASYLAEAEATLLATNLFIPLGAPIRWSQVRAGIEGYSENAWAFHPLFPLSRAPI